MLANRLNSTRELWVKVVAGMAGGSWATRSTVRRPSTCASPTLTRVCARSRFGKPVELHLEKLWDEYGNTQHLAPLRGRASLKEAATFEGRVAHAREDGKSRGGSE